MHAPCRERCFQRRHELADVAQMPALCAVGLRVAGKGGVAQMPPRRAVGSRAGAKVGLPDGPQKFLTAPPGLLPTNAADRFVNSPEPDKAAVAAPPSSVSPPFHLNPPAAAPRKHPPLRV